MKQKLVYIVLIAVLFGFSSVFATANVTLSDVTLSNPVERSNPFLHGNERLYDDEDELAYVNFIVPITVENGTVNITSATVSLPGLAPISFATPIANEPKFTVTLTVNNQEFNLLQSGITVPVSEEDTAEIAVSVLVPGDLDAINKDFTRRTHTARLTLQTSEGPRHANLNFFVVNMLEIRREFTIVTPDRNIRCQVSNQFSVSLRCDSDINELRPSQNFNLEFDVQNRFRSRTNMDFENVMITFDSTNRYVKSRNFDIERDIRADSQLSVREQFIVDSRFISNNDRSTIEITGEVTDFNGAVHGFRHTFSLRFRVEDFDVALTHLEMFPQSVCPGDEVTITYTLQNEGIEEQENVRVFVRNTQLGLSELISGITLEAYDERDNSKNGEIRFRVPSNAQARTYNIDFSYEFRLARGVRSETETRALLVRDCTPTQPTTPTPPPNNQTTGDIEVQPPTTTPGTQTPPTSSGQQQEQPRQVITDASTSSNDTLYVALLIVGILILLVAIISLIIYLVR